MIFVSFEGFCNGLSLMMIMMRLRIGQGHLQQDTQMRATYRFYSPPSMLSFFFHFFNCEMLNCCPALWVPLSSASVYGRGCLSLEGLASSQRNVATVRKKKRVK